MDDGGSGIGRGLANGLLGAIVFMVIFIGVIIVSGGGLYLLGFGGDDDFDEVNQANIIFNNQCNTTVNITVYIMGAHEWDKIYLTIDDNEQDSIMVKWTGDLQEMLVTYDIYDELKAHRYNVNPNENQIVILM